MSYVIWDGERAAIKKWIEASSSSPLVFSKAIN